MARFKSVSITTYTRTRKSSMRLGENTRNRELSRSIENIFFKTTRILNIT